MMHSNSCPNINRIEPPSEEINRIWKALCDIDKKRIRDIIDDIPRLSEVRINWNLLEAISDFWDPLHAIFDIHGNEITPTIEENHSILERSTLETEMVELKFIGELITSMSRLLGVKLRDFPTKLGYTGSPEIEIVRLIRFIYSKMVKA